MKRLYLDDINIIYKLDKNSNDGRGKIFQDIFNIAPIIEISYIHILCDVNKKEDIFCIKEILYKIFKFFKY